MLRRSHRLRVPAPAGGEDGFTLIEVLVAILAGAVVTGALFTILDVSLQQSTRVRNETYSDQLGRTAMTKIVDELQSACYYTGITPVKTESSSTALVFTTAYGAESEPTTAYEHDILWQAESGSSTSGTLTDYYWKSSGGTWPEFQFPTINVAKPTSSVTKPTVVQIATHVSANPEGGGSTPLFRYYAFATASSSSATTPVRTLATTPLAVPLTSASAETAAAVKISFSAAGSSATSPELERAMNLSSQVTFAMGAPNSEIPIEDSPCQ